MLARGKRFSDLQSNGIVLEHYRTREKKKVSGQRTHVALINPLVSAIYKNNGNNYELAKNKNQVKLAIQAIREGFNTLKHLGFSIAPEKRNVLQRIPLFVLMPFVRMFLNSSFSEIAMAEHSRNAIGEMAQLSNEFNCLIEKIFISTSAIN
jgi:hypothetical protein